MKTLRPSHRARLVLFGLPAVLGLVASVVPACSSSNPAPPGTSSSVSSTTSSSSGGTGGGGGAGTSSASSAGTGGATTSSSGGTGGGDAGPPCVSDGGATGCYSCPPATNEQFLNACAPNGDQCTHFDNATQLPFWDGGALPVP